MARQHSYEVQKGNEVLPAHVGKTVSWMKAQTIGEALGLPQDIGAKITSLIVGATRTDNPHFENEAALVAAGEQQRDIAVREDIRGVLGTPDGTIDAAAKVANELTIGSPREGGKVSKKAKPATQQKRAEQSVGNRLFEKMEQDEKLRSRMFRDGIADEDAYNAWLTARDAAKMAAEVDAKQAAQAQA